MDPPGVRRLYTGSLHQSQKTHNSVRNGPADGDGNYLLEICKFRNVGGGEGGAYRYPILLPESGSRQDISKVSGGGCFSRS